MAKLPQFTLGYDNAPDAWQMRIGAMNAVRSFDTKTVALKGGVLEKTVGSGGGSAQIRKQNGTIQKERTYSGSADPKRSPG